MILQPVAVWARHVGNETRDGRFAYFCFDLGSHLFGDLRHLLAVRVHGFHLSVRVSIYRI